MTVLLEVPMGSESAGGALLVEADLADIPADLVLATPLGGSATAKATRTMVDSLGQLDGLLRLIKEGLDTSGPDNVEIQFGVKLGGETGLILAKGSAEVNLTVIMSWKAQAHTD